MLVVLRGVLQGGSYVMTASSESEAKSWVRAVQVRARCDSGNTILL